VTTKRNGGDRGMRRDKGHPRKTHLGFRASDSERTFIEERARREGLGMSDIVRQEFQFSKDFRQTLGAGWYELLRRADVANRPPGVVAAEHVLAAFEGEPKNHTKK
jgi:hypothetical protein